MEKRRFFVLALAGIAVISIAQSARAAYVDRGGADLWGADFELSMGSPNWTLDISSQAAFEAGLWAVWGDTNAEPDPAAEVNLWGIPWIRVSDANLAEYGGVIYHFQAQDGFKIKDGTINLNIWSDVVQDYQFAATSIVEPTSSDNWLTISFTAYETLYPSVVQGAADYTMDTPSNVTEFWFLYGRPGTAQAEYGNLNSMSMTTNIVVPEPMTVGFLALGGMVLLRRKRK
jgi:hypothetical protein